MSDLGKFDPLLGRLRTEDTKTVKETKTEVHNYGGGSSDSNSGSTAIHQYDSDPASPSAEDAWVLRIPGAPAEPAGVLSVGTLLPYTLSAGEAAGLDLYRFSYKTNEGTIIRTTLS